MPAAGDRRPGEGDDLTAVCRHALAASRAGRPRPAHVGPEGQVLRRTTSFLLDDNILIDAGTGVGDLTLEMVRIDRSDRRPASPVALQLGHVPTMVD